jgi:ribonuclease HI
MSVLIWVPWHIRISGNETADAMAKEAARQPWIPHYTIAMEDIKYMFNPAIAHDW